MSINLWSVIELDVGIVCANLPSLRLLVTQLKKTRKPSTPPVIYSERNNNSGSKRSEQVEENTYGGLRRYMTPIWLSTDRMLTLTEIEATQRDHDEVDLVRPDTNGTESTEQKHQSPMVSLEQV